jgi:hypothetical protein
MDRLNEDEDGATVFDIEEMRRRSWRRGQAGATNGAAAERNERWHACESIFISDKTTKEGFRWPQSF